MPDRPPSQAPVGLALSGRRVIVTGAATGIGAAAVQSLHAAGAEVHATFHRTAPPAELADLATWTECDARDATAVRSIFDAAARAMGGLDVLVHAAGLWRAAIPETLSEEDIDFLFATNFKTTVFANQAAHDLMADSGGAIINFGSSEAVNGNPFAPLYAASKSAIHAWTRSAARAWGPKRITVNSLAPAVETPGAERLRAYLGPEASAAFSESHKSRFPIGGGLGDPLEDLGPMLVFLASPGARFITGQLLAVDGGLMMLGA
jgi:3-oxoacyl-[acyl-carrier protein] reductase